MLWVGFGIWFAILCAMNPEVVRHLVKYQVWGQVGLVYSWKMVHWLLEREVGVSENRDERDWEYEDDDFRTDM
jgi:hypothetical protein